MKNIYGMTIKSLEDYFVANNDKKYRAIQVFEWLYKKRIHNFDEMRNIKKEVVDLLKKDFSLECLAIVEQVKDTDVAKFLFKLSDDQTVEAVLMNHDYGYSLCVSSQVGCNMGCTFCESGRLKKKRNLDTYEMVLQILMIEELTNIHISHVVIMGIGEPFDNYDNVMAFIDIINTPKGIDLGARHITISTCGIIPKIEEFMNYDKQINLAISLHASNDELRSKLMPINKAYPLKELIEVIKKYIAKTNRRVTFEYIMLKDVNDSLKYAEELSILLKGMNCYVNLIPYNENSHIDYNKSSKEQILLFYDVLKKNDINVTIRREFGSKVMAACGQLRANYKEEK